MRSERNRKKAALALGEGELRQAVADKLMPFLQGSMSGIGLLLFNYFNKKPATACSYL
jgi:hypothetical protein